MGKAQCDTVVYHALASPAIAVACDLSVFSDRLLMIKAEECQHGVQVRFCLIACSIFPYVLLTFCTISAYFYFSRLLTFLGQG